MNIRALNFADYSQHPRGDIRLHSFIKNIKNIKKNKSNGHWNLSDYAARKKNLYDLLLTKVVSRLVSFQGNKLRDREWKINSPYQQSTMLSEFIVTLLYPFHARWINCVNMQYFHLNWWRGAQRTGGKRAVLLPFRQLGSSSFLTKTAHWDRANTISQLVNLCMSFTAWSQKTWWAKPSSGLLVPAEVKAPGLTWCWSHHEWQHGQCQCICPSDKSTHNRLTGQAFAIYWWQPKLG